MSDEDRLVYVRAGVARLCLFFQVTSSYIRLDLVRSR
jgi:hypothetical protein